VGTDCALLVVESYVLNVGQLEELKPNNRMAKRRKSQNQWRYKDQS
jgi:hypothetical protein